MTASQVITLRFVIPDPVPGVAYSLQDKKSRPVGQVIAGEAPVAFDVPAKLAPGPKLSGEFVRREGPDRRFVYIAVGGQAGQAPCVWSRRAKIDVHDLSADLLERASAGAVLKAELPGRAKDGGPACATVRPTGGWRAIEPAS